MALGSIGGALQRLGPLSAKVQPIFITLDPERDVPDVMSAYLKNFDSRIVGLTGTEQQIDAAASAYHVYHAIFRTGDGRDDYLVDHSSLIYLMNPEGKFAAVFGSDISSNALATQIRILIGNLS
jgi:protein SCO1/2